MNKNRFAKRVAAAAGFLLLCAVPGLTSAQSLPPAPVQTPGKTSRPVRPKKDVGPMDDFAGLNYTEEQKAKIGQIYQDMKSRMDAVLKDDKLSPEQKGAMLQGFQHMERGEVYNVLTPEQQIEVRKKVFARRTAAQKEQEKKQQPPQPPPA
jgi:Spy/CpxP family protein refolding chaperone